MENRTCNSVSVISKMNLLPIVLLVIIVIDINAQGKKSQHKDDIYSESKELNIKSNGFKGIWYMN